ncbi:Sigma-70, region 4 [[Clostridium] bolteae]|jgi:DNA-directed RNA polymerase specialized sigma24 family protein|uniref:Sigma-70, region 4 n=2 Tax=Enterocloster bolteae TaxID=208479 RepID=A0A6N2U3E5_9FIRM
MNGAYEPPLTAPSVFAGEQTRGDSKGCCRPSLSSQKGGFSMTETEYQMAVQRTHDAYCKTVIRHAAITAIRRLQKKWEREISLDYLTNEKFIQFAEPEPDEEHPFTVCGQTVLLSNAALADAISVLPEQTREEILRYYFLRQPQRVIGAHIGRSRSTAGRHIRLALQRLREEMEVSRYE